MDMIGVGIYSPIKGEHTMATTAIQKGDKFRCPDANCGCEVEVTKGCAKPGAGENMNPHCCCGKEMKKV
jgi:hypothetical protein